MMRKFWKRVFIEELWLFCIGFGFILNLLFFFSWELVEI